MRITIRIRGKLVIICVGREEIEFPASQVEELIDQLAYAQEMLEALEEEEGQDG